MASWFTRAVDRITPWDRGGEVQRRQEKKKKDEEAAYRKLVANKPYASTPSLSVATPTVNQNIVTPKPQQPVNVFEDLNKNLVFNKPQTAVSVLNNQSSALTPKPQPGQVITPTSEVKNTPNNFRLKLSNGTYADQIPDTPEMLFNRGLDRGQSWEDIARENNLDLKSVQEFSQSTRPDYGIKLEKPKQGIGNRFRDIFDANTEADKYRRYQGNQEAIDLGEDNRVKPLTLDRPGNIVTRTPIVGHVVKTANTISNQFPKVFYTAQNQLATAEYSAATEEYVKAVASKDQARIAAAKERVRKATDRVKDIENVLNAADEGFQENSGGLFNAGTLYDEEASRTGTAETALKDIALPTAVSMLDLYTLGRGNAIEQAIKEGGLKIGARAAAPDIVKAAAGNYLSGDLGTRAEGGSNEQAVKSGLINSVLGLIPDIGIPALAKGFKNKVVPKFMRGRGIDPKVAVEELDDAAISASAEAANQALKPRPIPVKQNIPIDEVIDEGLDVPVTRVPGKPSSIIEEIVGDAKTVGESATGVKEISNAVEVPTARPDPRIEGVSTNPADVFTTAKKAQAQELLDDYLKVGKIGEEEHKTLSEELAKMPTADEPVAPGQKIEVKQVNGIDVMDKTDVPTNLPETPGKVRVTTQTSPSIAKSEAVAATPPVVNPAKVADETIDNATSETLPRVGETDEVFLKRVATDMQSNIERAVEALKSTKKMTKAERARRAAAGQKAYEEAKAAGKSISEQEQARKAAYGGTFDRQDYEGTPVHGADEQRLRDMVDSHYSDMPYQAGKVREAFTKLFHAGEPGWASEAGNHIIPSDIKAIRKFLNESVPNPDGSGGLGDFAEPALKELAEDNGPGKIAQAIGLQRALRFTADISATGRQALPQALSHPIEFARAAKKSFEVMFSHEKYQKFVNELATNKEANYINDRMGAYLSVLNDDISKADDIYRNSGWAHKIPGVKNVVAASERQYNTLLSSLRYQTGKRFIDAAGGIGTLEKIASDTGDPEAFLKAIGTVANVNTGRGFGKALDTGASKILSDVLVSPRGLAARIQRFNPKYYMDLWKANPAAAKEAIRSMAIQTGLTTSALAAANQAGIYEDGQIKIGNTRYDITGSAANMVRTAVRVAQFMSGNRETTPFNSAESEITRWARNQLAPFISTSLDTIGIHQDPKTGTWVNRWGEDVTLASTALHNFAPVNVEQVVNDVKAGTPAGQTTVNALLNTVGAGVNTFESAEDKKLPKDKSVRDIYKQLVKEGIGTSTSDINTYIADRDYDKATRAADYNLMALQSEEGASPSKIKNAEVTLQEIALRQQGVPMTEEGIQGAVESGDWDKAISAYEWKIEKAKADGEFSKAVENKIQTDIKRIKVTRDGGFSPETAKLYQDMSVEEWRKMGDPDSEDYDPELYQTLWRYDQQMAEADASRSSFKSDKPKYSVATKKGGRGKGRGSIDTSFGTLKAGSFAPRVQEYASIDSRAGAIPIIRTVRPNIVHKISSSG